MQPLVLLLLLVAPAAHPASPIETVGRAEIAQVGVRDSAAHRAVAVLDSLLPLPPPRALTAVQRQTWSEQTTGSRVFGIASRTCSRSWSPRQRSTSTHPSIRRIFLRCRPRRGRRLSNSR